MTKMRELTGHKVNPLNDLLELTVVDDPGQGNANHVYHVDHAPYHKTVEISFQNGPIGENGVNGISNEVLLEIVIDRLRGFQSGKYKCRENSIALTKLEEAKHWLHSRTRDRMDRGVEGTYSE